MIKLNDSGVVFDADAHTYTYEGKQLSGITKVISNQLFPDKYNGVSDEVLAKAAERGHRVHNNCAFFDTFGEVIGEEVEAYKKILEEFELIPVAHEYTVTDKEFFASNIDMVATIRGGADDEVVLCDYKTTYVLDTEFLSWQLSIYKMFFEMQNPHLKVVGLCGIWLPKEPKKSKGVYVLDRGEHAVTSLLDAEVSGEKYVPLPAEQAESISELTGKIKTALLAIKQLEETSENIKKELFRQMEQANVKKWSTDGFVVTRVLPSEQEKFDSKGFRETFPELYEQFKKKVKKKGYLVVKLK